MLRVRDLVLLGLPDALRLDNDTKSFDGLLQSFKKAQAVVVITVDVSSFVAASRDVLDCILKFDADGPCHGGCVANGCGDVKRTPETPQVLYMKTRTTPCFAENMSDVRS